MRPAGARADTCAMPGTRTAIHCARSADERLDAERGERDVEGRSGRAYARNRSRAAQKSEEGGSGGRRFDRPERYESRDMQVNVAWRQRQLMADAARRCGTAGQG